MIRRQSHLRLVSSQDVGVQREVSVAVIASITEMEVVVPWYLRAFSAFIPNPYLLTMQDFSEEYTNPLKIPTWTTQCNSFEDLRTCLKSERQRAFAKGRLVVVDYTHKLGIIELEFNG